MLSRLVRCLTMLPYYWTHNNCTSSYLAIKKTPPKKAAANTLPSPPHTYHHLLNSCLCFLHLSLGSTVTGCYYWPVGRLNWSNDIIKMGPSCYFISNATNSCNPHGSKKTGEGGVMPSLCQDSVLREEDWGGGN